MTENNPINPTFDTPFFSTPALSGLVQQLTHLAQFGANVLVVEGVWGSGKSQLAGQLTKNFLELKDKNSVFAVAQINVAHDDRLENMAVALGDAIGLSLGEGQPVGEWLADIRAYSQNLLREKKLAIVLVDNAHLLDDETAGAVLSLAIGLGESSYGLRLILFSEPGLANRIDALSLHELTIYDFEMPSFGAAELERFLDSQDLLGGIEGKMQHIWTRSKGLPGRAIDLAEELHQAGSRSKSVASDIARMPVLHITMLAGLLAALLLVFLYRGDDAEVAAPTVAFNPPSAAAIEKLDAPKPKVEPTPAPLNVEKNLEPIDVPSLASAAETKPLAGDGDTVSRDSGLVQLNGLGQADISASAYLQDAEESISAEPSREAILDRPSQQDQVEVIPTVEGSKAETAEKSTLAPPSVVNEKSGFDRDEDYLMALPENNYALQLVAASRSDTLREYISSQPNKGKMKIYRRVRDNGAVWYIVVVGSYASRQLAQDAVKSLPDAQRKAGPWPKSLSSIKSEIEEFRSR